LKIVEEAVRPPGMCLASRDTEGPFIDTGLRAAHRDPYIYLSCRWIEEAARELGMVPKAEVDARFAKLEAEHEEYAEKLAALQRLADAATEFSEATEAVAGQSVEEEVQLPPETTNDIREMVPAGIMDEVSNGSGA
jgi:hypothetical protein